MGELEEQIAARLSVVEALEAAFEHRQAVVDLIAGAADRTQAEAGLVRLLNVDAAQAAAILDARLSRWTVAEQQQRRRELRDLRARLED